MSLPTNMMTRITTVADELLISQTLVDKDLAKFRLNKHCRDSVQSENRRSTRGYLKLQFHDKGIEMVNPPRILNSKPVADTIPSFLSHKERTSDSYSYTNTTEPFFF
jgi:hypothetical protein